MPPALPADGRQTAGIVVIAIEVRELAEMAGSVVCAKNILPDGSVARHHGLPAVFQGTRANSKSKLAFLGKTLVPALAFAFGDR